MIYRPTDICKLKTVIWKIFVEKFSVNFCRVDILQKYNTKILQHSVCMLPLLYSQVSHGTCTS